MFGSSVLRSSSLLTARRFQQKSYSRMSYGKILGTKFKRGMAASFGVGCSVAFATAFGLVYGQSEDPCLDDNEDKKTEKIAESDCNSHGRTQRSNQIINAIQRSFLQLEQMKEETGSPGVICAVSVDGEVVWKTAIGFSDVENGVKCGTDTLMRIASISKALTSIGLAKLWQDKKVNLDAPIQDYVDYFPMKEFDNEKVTITTRQLMSHTSGLRHYDKVLKDEKDDKSSPKETKNESDKSTASEESSDELSKKEYYIKDNYKTIKDAIQLFKNDPLLKKPGTDYLYSTHAWTLISAVIEKAGETDYVKYMKKMCYDLGLNNTMVELNDPLIYYRSRNYTRDKNGKLLNCPYVDNSYKWAGGGYLSSVGDLIKIGNVMLYCYQNTDKDSERAGYLSKDTVNQLWNPVPITTGKVSKRFPDMGYGLGWTIRPEVSKFGRNTRFAAMHTGSAVGASSVLLIVPFKSDENINDDDPGKSNSKSSNDHSPCGVVVAIMVNMQGVSLTETAFKIADNFQATLEMNSQ